MPHESDIDTETKFVELQSMEVVLNKYIKNIRVCQRDIRKLDMVATTQRNEDGTTEIIYTLPNNTAGNEIDTAYRTEQKLAIIINIDLLLAELNGFLTNE